MKKKPKPQPAAAYPFVSVWINKKYERLLGVREAVLTRLSPFEDVPLRPSCTRCGRLCPTCTYHVQDSKPANLVIVLTKDSVARDAIRKAFVSKTNLVIRLSGYGQLLMRPISISEHSGLRARVELLEHTQPDKQKV